MNPIFDTTNCVSFIVKNISPQKKTIHIFNYPIKLNEQCNLLVIPGISESDIKDSLLKGEIRHKFLVKDIELIYSNIDPLQYNICERELLENLGFNVGVSQLSQELVEFITSAGGSSDIGGITKSQHENLRQLIHFINDGPGTGFVSGAFKEILPLTSVFPTSIIWWESSAKLKKIVSKTFTYNPNKTPATIVWQMYAIDGVTVIATVSDTISYSGIFETTRIRNIS